jgi:hypothetical protein
MIMLQSFPFEVQPAPELYKDTAKQTTLMSFFKPTERSEPQPSTSSGTIKSQPLYLLPASSMKKAKEIQRIWKKEKQTQAGGGE